MKTKTLILSASLAAGLLAGNGEAQENPEGYWNLEQANEILDKTRVVVLDPDLSSLTAAEKAATDKLIKAGIIFNCIYQDSLHSQALESLRELRHLQTFEEHRSALLDIYYRSGGPITTTLDNKRVPFLPVTAEEPGTDDAA